MTSQPLPMPGGSFVTPLVREEFNDIREQLAATESLNRALRADVERVTGERDSLQWQLNELRRGRVAP
jgi:hypothetical protein